jgi:hypothetical protein
MDGSFGIGMDGNFANFGNGMDGSFTNCGREIGECMVWYTLASSPGLLIGGQGGREKAWYPLHACTLQ